MKLLVIGSGGREHALVWKLAQSRRVKKIFSIPGNGGIAQIAECINSIPVDDPLALADFAEHEKISLTVVGPELPLAAGVVDEFRHRGLKIFGPTAEAARIEGSKAFCKEIITASGVPTACAQTFTDEAKALEYLEHCSLPTVIKADGLAAGKGVVICQTADEARACVKTFMSGGRFGTASSRIVIEDFLSGEEASYFVISDGTNFIDFGMSQDHKRLRDGDSGPNTGGMGAYSPAFLLGEGQIERVRADVIEKTLSEMRRRGCPYEGFLYAGLMLNETGEFVLEFNARMGDPETQAVLPRLKSDLVDVIEAALSGRLSDVKLEWDPRPAVTIVMAAGGYPEKSSKGMEIKGLDDVSKLKDVIVFHAGTMLKNDRVYTNGGRVLAVTALDADFTNAVRRAYEAVNMLSFEDCQYRKDIGYRALKYCK